MRISTPNFRPAAAIALRDRTHPAHNVTVESLQFVLSATEQMKEKSDRRARLIRPAMLTVDVVGEEHGLDLLGLVISIEKLAEAARQKRNKLRDFLARDRPETFAHAEQIRPAMHAGGVEFRRRLEKEWLKVPSQFLQLIIDADKSLGVVGRKSLEFLLLRDPGRPTRK